MLAGGGGAVRSFLVVGHPHLIGEGLPSLSLRFPPFPIVVTEPGEIEGVEQIDGFATGALADRRRRCRSKQLDQRELAVTEEGEAEFDTRDTVVVTGENLERDHRRLGDLHRGHRWPADLHTRTTVLDRRDDVVQRDQVAKARLPGQMQVDRTALLHQNGVVETRGVLRVDRQLHRRGGIVVVRHLPLGDRSDGGELEIETSPDRNRKALSLLANRGHPRCTGAG